MTPRKPYQKPVLKFGKVHARKIDNDIMHGVKTYVSKDKLTKYYTVIQ